MLKKNSKGVILVFTIVVLTGLCFAVWHYISLGTIDTLKIRFSLNKLQSLYYAKAGLNYALTSVCRAKSQLLNEKKILHFKRGYAEYSIYNEDGKINLNSLITQEGIIDKNAENILGLILEKLHVDPGCLEALYDWIDEDDIARKNGAENSYYQKLGCKCKNDFLDNTEEIFLIKGFKENLRNIDLNILEKYITANSNGRININTAEELLLTALSPHLSEKISQEILIYRNNQAPFSDTKDILKVPGIDEKIFSAIKNIISVENNYFLIYSLGCFDKLTTQIKTIVHLDSNRNYKILFYCEH